MKNKQTAVEWLIEQICDMYLHSVYHKQFEQAKEIELDQHKYTFEHGFYCGRHTDTDRADAWNNYKDNLKSE
jgi:hypothetical protein